MELLLKGVAAALVVAVSGAHLRVARSRMHDHRRHVLEGCIGQHLRLVGGGGAPLKGLVRRVDRGSVAVRVVGAEVRVPFDQIQEIWRGRQLLARW